MTKKIYDHYDSAQKRGQRFAMKSLIPEPVVSLGLASRLADNANVRNHADGLKMQDGQLPERIRSPKQMYGAL